MDRLAKRIGSRFARRVTYSFPLLIVVLIASGCSSVSEPESALQTYVEAVQEGRCQEARNLLSQKTRYALDYLHEKPQQRQNALPVEEYYCGRFAFEHCQYWKTMLTAGGSNVALVSMPCGRSQDSIFPGFSSPFLKYEPRKVELVNEDGAWRIVEPTPIRIVEVREREDQLREEAIRRQDERRRQIREKAPAGP